MIYRDLTLNCCRDNMLRTKVTQSEHGAVVFKISLFNGNERIELSNCKMAVYYGTKPDNHVIGNVCQIEDNFVLLPLTLQMTTMPGKLAGVLELQFETGNVRFYGVNFEVFPSPESAKIESTDEFTLLEQSIAEVRKIVEEGLEVSTGKSAYEVAVDNGFEGSETEWLESLKGENGKDGKDGSNGADGENGKDGIGISKSEIIDGELVLTYSDGNSTNLGVVVGAGEESGGNTSEFLIDFTTEEEVQLLEFPLTQEVADKINNAQDIIVELVVKKPVADEGSNYGNIQVCFYSTVGQWSKALLLEGKISPSNSVSWGKDGYGISAIKKGKKTWVGKQMVYANNVSNSLNTSVIGNIWNNVSVVSGDKFRIRANLSMGIGTQVRLIVSAGVKE